MLKVWILRGIRKGVLTTVFPKAPPTIAEIPERSVPPTVAETSDWLTGASICPTKAIRSDSKMVDLERCIYCRCCAEAGFTFDQSAESRTKSLQAKLNVKSQLDEFTKRQGTIRRSLHVLMIDVGSCNACNHEVLNLANPYYDLTRLGIFFTNSPKHADALIVVGALNKAMTDVLKRTYESVPDPKFVISVGACAASGGIFQKTESFVSPIQDVIPVDVVIPGCPPSPIQILEGLLLVNNRMSKEVMTR